MTNVKRALNEPRQARGLTCALLAQEPGVAGTVSRCPASSIP
jgi:hypothetical protein